MINSFCPLPWAFCKSALLPAILFVLVATGIANAQQIIHVPADAPSLQAAINTVSNGGIVELAAGSYNAPNGAFTIYGGTKGFTIRAATGASVSLNGQGSTDILRFTDSTHPMMFERLTFINGATQNPFIGGALTLVNVQARFVSCTFQNNSANAGTGGGVLWIAASGVVFQDCTFDGNTSNIYGGAMSASDGSRVFVSGSRFLNNRTNLPGHVGNSAGGAIYGVDSFIQVSGSAFDNNQAGYAGGAIYLSGAWDRPVSQLLVADCKFTGNMATRDPSVNFAAAAVGGAIHTETQADTKITRSRFTDNVARQGGAVSIFQSIVQIDSCVFKGNRASGIGNEEGFGGTIMALSSPDNQGRRAISITATDTIFDGGGGTGAREGGCIFAAGDLNAAFGINGAGQNGSIESNRGTVRLTRVAITNFSAVAGGGLPGQGGAILGAFANVIIDDSIISNCSATDSGAGLQLIENSTTTITNSVIAGCSAATGAAITMFGGDLNASSTSFVANVTGNGRGAALTTAPSVATGGLPDFDVKGTIQNCKFTGNSGATVIYDGDRAISPFNRLQYSTNEFYPDSANLYIDDYAGPMSTAGLNNIVISASGTRKAPLANSAPTTSPLVAKLLILPPIVAQSGVPGEATPVPSYLAFASYGATAVLDGVGQSAAAGLSSTTNGGVHTLRVGSTTVSTTPPPSTALNISTRLPVGTGQNVLIGGFIVQGPTPKNVIIRAIGPSLPLPGALQDPFLELHDGTGAAIATNDNWRSTQVIDIYASSLAPLNDAESAIVATLNPGAYTAVVRGSNNTTGIAVVEAYDLDADRSSKLANIATRGSIQTGDNVMIGGFIVGGGTGPTKVLVRGIGPSLGAFGITNPLADPMLELHNSNGALIDSNDDWRTNQALIQATGLQPTNDAESALLLSNPAPGAYTVILRGKNNGTGVGVVEAYVL
jgi:hypothetical protein